MNIWHWIFTGCIVLFIVLLVFSKKFRKAVIDYFNLNKQYEKAVERKRLKNAN